MTAQDPTGSLLAALVDDPAAAGRGAGERAYAAIRTAIVRGTLRAGTVLGEDELASALGISRTPVRSALQTLLTEHLVESGPRRQVIVRGVSPEERREVMLLREALERVGVAEACARMTIDEVDHLRLLLIRQRRAAAAEAVEDFIDLDDQFHIGIAESAGLPMLVRFLGQIRAISRIMGLRAVTREGRFGQVLDEHERIVAALEARDAGAALAAIDVHLANTSRILTALDEEEAVPECRP
ncbi:MAG: GntR family transcriptional regulator, rspAB operon transcriptional repressor [Solirubrobacteraceae bacterium]|jgi:DNA-binding GntR family transcriptional regulator|nr:GntR family transcriptional regulator, rspAB operon transcriptional repressor [Solirubrobacteraceae bacterium]